MNNQPTIGSQVTIRARFKDKDGNLTDPSDVIFQVMKPSGHGTIIVNYTYTLGEIEKETVGVYTVKFIIDTSGDWVVRPKGAGALIAESEDFKFTVKRSVFYA